MNKLQITNPKSQTSPKSQVENPNDKFFNLFIVNCLLFVICVLHIGISPLYAQDNNQLTALTKQIMEAKSGNELYPAFESLTDLYFKENKYNEYVDFLNSLIIQKENLQAPTSYYIALSRYYQLKYLEEQQLWEEYFNRGNAYRQDLTDALKKAILVLPETDPLSVYARLILWKFYKDQDSGLAQDTLDDLVKVTISYAQNTDNIAPLKDVAQELFAYGEKAKAKEIFRIYTDKIDSSGISDEDINSAAFSFYNEGNLDLAEDLYDIYIARIEKTYPKEKLIPTLIDIVKLFVYKSQGPSDSYYAEDIFKRIEAIGGIASFDEGLLYLRAFNLEKAKDYEAAKDIYIELLKLFPQGAHTDEAEFKIAAIFVFVSGDIKNGRQYYEKLAAKENLSPQVIASLYQLGLLSQWEADYEKAKNYYNKLIELAKDGFSEIVALTRLRIDEIEQEKPIEYNLKTFLDICLKPEYLNFNWTKTNLKAAPVAKKDSPVNVSTDFSVGATGCMAVQLQYLWSQDAGKTIPSAEQGSFSTEYSEIGTKIISVVVVSPSGFSGRDMVFVDIE